MANTIAMLVVSVGVVGAAHAAILNPANGQPQVTSLAATAGDIEDFQSSTGPTFDALIPESAAADASLGAWSAHGEAAADITLTPRSVAASLSGFATMSDWALPAHGSASYSIWFTLTEPTPYQLFGAAQASGESDTQFQVLLYSVELDSYIVSHELVNAAGEYAFSGDLLPGTYFLSPLAFAQVDAELGPFTASASGTMTFLIPAPGAASLAAMAGLGFTRRRRG